ncbi:uncharacterized protein B0H18DRAFT_1210570 [Fomitopsis serialis]|uniref:uncharacterized protein n=1 Tax=Fomitopsis serialis TaxID=139415 RepID=UPI002008B7F7|nr:uncharacterized protein B0H18DRAFT_1210570 [Neoantrodia serialis]KAH9927576.1 hypothetical protein B0H18DRAFT_1210570 [Neoantrodia serialis]
MLIFAFVMRGAAALIGALALIAPVPLAAPGTILILRECARSLDCSTCGNMLMLEYSRNMGHYQRVVKHSLNTLFVAHGLPPARLRYGLEPPQDSEFVRLIQSGCGYPGGLCSPLYFNPTQTTVFDGLVRPTMVPTRPSVEFQLSDDSELPPLFDYVWSTTIAVPVMVSTAAGELANPAASPLSNAAHTVTASLLSTEARLAPAVNMVDLVPLMATGLFLFVLVIGACLAPPRYSVKSMPSWRFVSSKASLNDTEFWRKYDDLEAGLAPPGSAYPVGDASRPCSSSSPASTSMPVTAPQTVHHIAERPPVEEVHVGISSASGRGSIPGDPLGSPPG